MVLYVYLTVVQIMGERSNVT